MAAITTASLAIVVFILLTYRYLVYPVFISPLAKIPPAHWSSSISPIWILYTRRRGNPNATTHAAHQKLGPIVRLGPNEISVNCVDGGIRTIYGGGYEKGSWYAVFRNYGATNVFSSPSRAEHSARKRMMSNVYAKSTLQASATLKDVGGKVICRRLLPELESAAKNENPVEMYSMFSGAAMDFVSCYIFGTKGGSDFLADPERCKRWLIDYKARQDFIFWPQEMPRLTNLAKLLGLKHWLIPRWVDQANANIESWIMNLCEAAETMYQQNETTGDEETAPVYNQLTTMMKKATGKKKGAALNSDEKLEIASELLDHIAAGFDTTGITLTYLAWELSRPDNTSVQEALRKELLDTLPRYQPATADEGHLQMPDLKDLDGLPLLHAIVMESLRLHAAIPGIQPRVTPQNAELGPIGCSVSGLPAGVRVSSQAYSLHLNEEVFPHAVVWDPYRWINAEGNVDTGGERGRWFWAFGSGGRMCIGSNLAMLEMKSLVAAIWANFTTQIADDRGMAHRDGYISEPIGTPEGDYLRLRFCAIDSWGAACRSKPTDPNTSN